MSLSQLSRTMSKGNFPTQLLDFNNSIYDMYRAVFDEKGSANGSIFVVKY